MGGADPTFASAKVKNAIGRIGIFLVVILVLMPSVISVLILDVIPVVISN